MLLSVVSLSVSAPVRSLLGGVGVSDLSYEHCSLGWAVVAGDSNAVADGSIRPSGC